MPEPTKATRWGVRAVDTGCRLHINGLLFDFDPRAAADLAETIRVILGIEKPAEQAEAAATEANERAARIIDGIKHERIAIARVAAHLDTLIADGFGARTDTLRHLRATLTVPASPKETHDV